MYFKYVFQLLVFQLLHNTGCLVQILVDTCSPCATFPSNFAKIGWVVFA